MTDPTPPLGPDDVAALFTRADGAFLFARWGRSLAPVAFGVDDATIGTLRTALGAVVTLAGHHMAEADPELGANLMFFFVREWEELPEVPDLDRLIPDLHALCDRLEAAGANQYRIFRFDPSFAIKAAFVLIRMDADLAAVPAATLALSQAVQVILLWSDRAFTRTSPLALTPAGVILRPEIGALIRAAYDPVLPGVAQDAAHAHRLVARIGRAS